MSSSILERLTQNDMSVKMCCSEGKIVATLLFVTLVGHSAGVPPIKFSIQCEPEAEKLKTTSPLLKRNSKIPVVPASDEPRTLCESIQRSLPEGIGADGKFVLSDGYQDAVPEGDTQYVVALPPPKDFNPYPKETTAKPEKEEEDSSSEKMEKFKRGVEKMSHFVNILGHLDQYLTDRARHAVTKLSKIVHE